MLNGLRKWSFRLLWAWGLQMVFCGIAAAAPLQDLQQDLQPAAGFVILAKDDLYLVDMDADQGLMAGDLLVIQPDKEEVFHPKTGEVIQVKRTDPAVLRVTMVDDGFSRAALVTPGKKIEAGMPVTRYGGLQAYLVSDTGGGRQAYARLSAALPHLLWQGYQVTSAAKAVPDDIDLLFRLQDETLTVASADGEEIRRYPWPAGAAETQAASSGTQPAPATQAIAAADSEVQSQEPVFLGTVDGTLVMADFVRHGGTILAAVTDGKTIRIFEVGEDLRHVAAADLPLMAKALTLAWWQPAADQKPYLVVGSALQRQIPNSASTETSISSIVYRFDNRSLIKQANVPGMLAGSFDADQDNRFELLLAQEFLVDNASPPVVQLAFQDGRLREVPLPVALPKGFRVNGSAFADLDGDRQPEVVQVDNGHLTVYKENRQLYRFPRKFGGSLSRLSYDRFSGSTDPLIDTRFFQIAPQTFQVDKSGKVNVIAVGADIPTLRAPGFGPGVSKTWLTMIEHDGRRFLKKDLEAQFDHPIQGLWIDDRQIFLVVARPGNIFGRNAESDLFRLPLQ